MSIKIAINGYGRIGRNILRALNEGSNRNSEVQIVAINDISDADATNTYLTQLNYSRSKIFSEIPVESYYPKNFGLTNYIYSPQHEMKRIRSEVFNAIKANLSIMHLDSCGKYIMDISVDSDNSKVLDYFYNAHERCVRKHRYSNLKLYNSRINIKSETSRPHHKNI